MGELEDGREGALRRTLARAQRRLRGAKLHLKSRFGLFRPLRIEVYRSHGTVDRLQVIGRVLEETGTRPVGERTGRLRNVLDTLHRLESDEVPDARLRVRGCGAERDATTDQEGFFSLELRCGEPVATGWHPIEVTLLASLADQTGVTGRGEVLVPASDCEFGVISDLDDTVVNTGARRRLTHARILLSRNAYTHEPFPGVAELYRLLLEGADARGANPIFYVSRSAWSLYDLFVDFLDRHGFPKGPMHLMDAAIVEDKSVAVGSEDHKLETVAEILERHPRLPFVLIGDSGQGDAELFLEATRRWPDRIRAVYVRDVTADAREEEVASVLREIEAAGVPALASADAVEMARHAERLGLIRRGGAERVEHARRERVRAGASA